MATPEPIPRAIPEKSHISSHESATITNFTELQHTFGHIECPACEATRNDTLGHDPDSLLSQKFSTAAALWLSTRKPYLKERTFYMYGHHIETLDRFFGELTIGKIHLGLLREYQKARVNNAIPLPNHEFNKAWQRKAGPSVINHEMSVMQQILKRAGRWKLIAHHYEPLPLPPEQKPKVMTEQEEHRLFEIAASSVEYELAFLVASLSVNTTACGSELRNIRLRDISLTVTGPRFVVDAATAKNDPRGRTIPLNPTAAFQMARCIKRANSLGSILPEHYLFPKRLVRGLWDPYSPASTSWLRNSFKAMREAAALPWLTPHCLRHQAITKLLELGTPPEVVKSISGHISDRMMRHYSHTRYAASFDALSRIDSSMSVKSSKIQARRA
jgi:integrase